MQLLGVSLWRGIHEYIYSWSFRIQAILSTSCSWCYAYVLHIYTKVFTISIAVFSSPGSVMLTPPDLSWLRRLRIKAIMMRITRSATDTPTAIPVDKNVILPDMLYRCLRIQSAAVYYYGIRKIVTVMSLHLRVLVAKCTPYQPFIVKTFHDQWILNGPPWRPQVSEAIELSTLPNQEHKRRH